MGRISDSKDRTYTQKHLVGIRSFRTRGELLDRGKTGNRIFNPNSPTKSFVYRHLFTSLLSIQDGGSSNSLVGVEQVCSTNLKESRDTHFDVSEMLQCSLERT